MFAHGRQKAIARRKVSPVSIAEGIFLGGNGSSNYYHWLVEIASKLQMLESLPESLRAFPLLVNSRLLQMPGYAEVLKVLAPCKHVLYLEEGESYLVRKGIFIEPFVSAPFNLREGNKFAAGQFSARPEAIHYLRNAVLRAAVEPQTEQWPQRIYLPCIRRPYSQDELIALAAKRGFVVIHPEQYPFLKQAAFFANARVIIGPLGAAWANLVFASPRCKGLSWMPMEKGEEAAYSNIAGILGIDLQYLVYSSGVQSTMRFYNHSYYICPAAFEKALDRIIKQQCNE
jgi:capsular polysaccharide biosynthesis protein